jgi:hypothetical protein
MVVVAPPFVAHRLAEHPTQYPSQRWPCQPHREHSGHRQTGFGPCRQVDACNPALTYRRTVLLAALERHGWAVLHDLAIPRSQANIDHLVMAIPVAYSSVYSRRLLV